MGFVLLCVYAKKKNPVPVVIRFNVCKNQAFTKLTKLLVTYFSFILS